MPGIKVTQAKIKRLRSRLEVWGQGGIGSYPWRYQNDPYKVFVAEIMLHRTQAHQVIDVYVEFIDTFPTLESFVSGDQNRARQMLAPLGLNWRIEGMIAALQSLWQQYQAVPAERQKLIREKSVGEYIAGATETFSMNVPQTLIDTNTVRVVGRVFGLNLEGEARRRKEIVDTIASVRDPDNPRDFYYAIIDLAHKVCKPQQPNCDSCPLLKVPCKFGTKLDKAGGTD